MINSVLRMTRLNPRHLIPLLLALAAVVLLAACGGPGATPTAGPGTPGAAKPGVQPTFSSTLVAPAGTPVPYTPSLVLTPAKPGGATTVTPPAGGTTAAAAPVSFSRDILPIINQQCRACHVDQSLGGLSLKDYDSLMKGGQRGVAVVKASPDTSLLVRKLRGDPQVGERMPMGGPALQEDSIRKISDWIRQGAPNN